MYHENTGDITWAGGHSPTSVRGGKRVGDVCEKIHTRVLQIHNIIEAIVHCKIPLSHKIHARYIYIYKGAGPRGVGVEDCLF